MNQKQREFLIKKIDKERTTKTRTLSDSKPKKPELSAYLYKAIMRGELKPLSGDEIVSNLEKLADESADAKSFLKQKDRWGVSSSKGNSNQVVMPADALFKLPEKYLTDMEEWKAETKRISDEIYEINTVTDTLITRIQLASNKVLETLISEVDDMGNISLVDTNLKLLISQ